MGRLLLLFIAVPIAELYLLIEIGKQVGTAATIGLIVFTGVLGAWLARRQGLGVLKRMQEQTAAGALPASEIVDGALILMAGAVLMTPGVLTDAFGFLLLVPAFRTLLKSHLRRRFERAVERGRVHVDLGGGPFVSRGSSGVRDVTPREPDGDERGSLPR